MKFGSPLNVKWEETSEDYDVKGEYGRIVGVYSVERWWFENRLSEADILSKLIEKFKGHEDVDIKYVYIKYTDSKDLGNGRFKDFYDVDIQFYGKGIAFTVIIALLLITIIVGLVTYMLVFTPKSFFKAGGMVLTGLGMVIVILLLLLLLRRRR